MKPSRAVGALVVLLSVVACQGGADRDGRAAPDPAPASTPSPTAAPASPSSPSASPTASASPARSPSAAQAVVTTSTVFASPTGNIVCELDPRSASVVCDIAERDWDPPVRYPECDFTSGSTVALSDDTVDFLCGDDAVGSPKRTLHYGETITGGDITCSSAETGITCKEDRHGFTLARAQFAVF